MGRTGRKRAGRVEVLLAEAREEANWDKANEYYKSVQSSIIQGETLELFADVERLLPDHIKPKCLETNMVMEEYVRDAKPSKSNTSAPKGTKRKRIIDVMRNIPDGAVQGFVPSSKLISKRDSKRRKVTPVGDSESDVDGGHRAIEAGMASSPEVLRGKHKTKAKVKTATKSRNKAKGVKKRDKKTISLDISLSQLEREMADDTDDREIELGIKLPSPAKPLIDVRHSSKPSIPFPSSPISIRSSPEPSLSMAKVDEDFVAVDKKPLQQSDLTGDHSWLLDSDSDIEVIEDACLSVDRQSSESVHSGPTTCHGGSRFRRSPLSHVPEDKFGKRTNMLSPPVPTNATNSSNSFPEPTFAVRLPGVRRKRPRISSPPLVNPQFEKDQFSSPASSPPPCFSKSNRGPIDSRPIMELLDLEAQHSGDETVGSSDHEDVESESDRR